MCIPALAAIGATISQGAAAAAGAVGSAVGGATIGQVLSIAGTAASIGGTLYAGQQQAAAARTQAEYLKQQSQTERALSVVEDERTRARMRAAIAQQRSELAGRGVSLDSPTAVLLGRTAARELSFASQSVRSGGQARQIELSSMRRGFLARAGAAALDGRLSAAGLALEQAPKLWPGLADKRVLT